MTESATFGSPGGRLAALLLSVALGCAGGEPTAEEALTRGPLPYHVGVFLDAETLYYEAPGAEPAPARAGGGGGAEQDASPEARYLGDEAAILALVENALAIDNPVVSQVQVLRARDRSRALAEAKDLDLLLAVGFETPPEFSRHEWPASWGALEITSWLFGGIPSWFVPSRRYYTDTRLTVEGVDLHQRRLRRWLSGSDVRRSAPRFDWNGTVNATVEDTSLFDRSAPLDRPGEYAFTIIVPPVVVEPGDTGRLSRSLTDDINADLGRELAALVKERLLAEEATKPLRVAFLSPNPLEEVEEDDVGLRLGIASADRVKVTSLLVSRRGPQADRVQWRATAPELEALNAAIARQSAPDGFASFAVPQRIALDPGVNVVKVTAGRQDGEMVARTMVFFR